MATFLAKYRSQYPCPVCGMHIEIGQPMTWSRRGDRRVYHQDCYSKQYGTGTVIEASTYSSGNGTAAQTAKETVINTVSNGITKPEVALMINQSESKIITDTLKAANETARFVAETVSDRKIEEFLKTQKTEIVVTVKTDTSVTSRNIGIQHKNFEMLLTLCNAHLNGKTPINVWIPGPAGSGKTHAAEQVAKALGLPFYSTGAIVEPFMLLGYKDANGSLVRTPFREAYEHGGVFLQDEVDGSDANALLSFNQALANGHCAFPDGMIPRHKDCIIIAAANTFGLGGTSDYVGRVKLDAATLSRYVWLDWPYDEDLERKLCPDSKWADRVIAIRHKCKTLGLKILVTPRATFAGAELLANGIPQAMVEVMTIKQGMTDEQWNQVKAGA